VIGKYHQHSVDVLDKSMTVLDFFMASYPNTMKFKRDLDEWRGYLGRYGVSGGASYKHRDSLSAKQCEKLGSLVGGACPTADCPDCPLVRPSADTQRSRAENCCPRHMIPFNSRLKQ